MVACCPFLHVRGAGAVAQLVEHYVRNVGVVSSNLIRSTSFPTMLELALPCSRLGYKLGLANAVLRAFWKRTVEKSAGAGVAQAEVGRLCVKMCPIIIGGRFENALPPQTGS